jgi:hypothetical protein
MEQIEYILSDANKDIKTILVHKNNTYLRNIMEAAFMLTHKLILPEGTPPYKENKMSSHQNIGAFWQEAKKLYVYRREDLPSIRREHMFIQALENLSANESIILLAVKEQNMETLYPNLSLDSLTKVGYFA